MIIIDGATFKVEHKSGNAVLIVQRKPFEFAIKITREELQQHIAELTRELARWPAACSPDYYGVLGLSRLASPSDIKRAYRKKSRQYHPDVSAHTGPEMAELNQAYETLSDPAKRQQYDQHCPI